jgi:hypothetical protein
MQISGKDLHYLTDAMSWELLAMKKCHHYAREVQDPEVLSLINHIGQMHQRHYETLLSQLQAGAGAAGGTQIGPMTQQSPSGMRQ